MEDSKRTNHLFVTGRGHANRNKDSWFFVGSFILSAFIVGFFFLFGNIIGSIDIKFQFLKFSKGRRGKEISRFNSLHLFDVFMRTI